MSLLRGGVVALAAAVVLSGCGGSSGAKQRREAVNAYIVRIDRAQSGLVAATGEIDAAFAKFRLRGNSPRELRELAFAGKRIETALRGVRAVHPPPEARRLHTKIMQLLSLQRSIAAELLWIARYQPKFEGALTPLAGAGKRLSADIRQAAKSQPAPTPTSAAEKLGASVFVGAGCGACHSLSATGSTGTRGPNLDVLRLAPAQIAAQVRQGGGGMPSFAKRLSQKDITAVAAFVASAERRQASDNAVVDAYSSAFARYRDSIARILATLDALSAPPVLQPTLDAERRTMRRAAALSNSVAIALHRRDLDAANKAVARLFKTAATADQGNTRSAAAAAVRVYNRRLRQVAVLSAAIAKERQRLVVEVG